MSSNIHPTAIIEDGAQLDPSVIVGAYAYIGGSVKIGKDSIVHHHATVEGNTEMGERNEVFPYALIGGKTHDLKHQGGAPGLKVGNDNTLREYVTIHVATNAGEYTTVGSNNNILAYSHIAHDCKVGDRLIMSSHAALGGHVEVEDNANIGWAVGIHQFCRVGSYCMVGFNSKVTQDVPPYMLVDGNPSSVRAFNKIGLERAGFSSEDIAVVKEIYMTLYRAGYNRSQAMEHLKSNGHADHPLVGRMLSFVDKSSRGLVS